MCKDEQCISENASAWPSSLSDQELQRRTDDIKSWSHAISGEVEDEMGNILYFLQA